MYLKTLIVLIYLQLSCGYINNHVFISNSVSKMSRMATTAMPPADLTPAVDKYDRLPLNELYDTDTDEIPRTNTDTDEIQMRCG